jgi:hypothetical protein
MEVQGPNSQQCATGHCAGDARMQELHGGKWGYVRGTYEPSPAQSWVTHLVDMIERHYGSEMLWYLSHRKMLNGVDDEDG